MTTNRRACFLATACVVLASASLALAGDPSLARPTSSEAQKHLDEGNRFYGVRDFDKAVAEYKAGALIEPAPVFDYNLAQCYRQLGRYKDAIWHYNRFLRYGHPQDPALVQSVQQHLDLMQAELDRKAMTQPPNDVAPAPASATQSPKVGTQSPNVATQSPSITAPLAPAEPWYGDKLGWGLTGAGVVGLGVAAGLGVDAANLRSQADASPNQEERQRLRDSASTRDLVGTVIAVGGAGLVVTGIIKLAMHSSPHRQTATAWQLGVTPDSVVVFGRF